MQQYLNKTQIKAKETNVAQRSEGRPHEGPTIYQRNRVLLLVTHFCCVQGPHREGRASRLSPRKGKTDYPVGKLN